MKVSVIVPTFNRAHYLRECLDSLLAQTVAASEIIVVNDWSTDNTAEILREYGKAVRVIEKPNGGKSSALNVWLERASGDLVWIMDDDDVALPDALERHVDALERNPDAGFTYSSYLSGAFPVGLPWREAVVGLEEVRMPSLSDDELFVRCLEACFIMHQSMVVRKLCYDEVGPFDESLPRAHDHEMNLRLARQYRGVRIGEPTFCLRLHAGERGTGTIRIPFERVEEFSRKDGISIYRRLHGELSLREYLPKNEQETPPEGWAVKALTQRARIMVRKGVFDLAWADFVQSLDEVRMGGFRRQDLRLLYDVEKECVLQGNPDLARNMRAAMAKMAGRGGLSAITDLAKPYYYTSLFLKKKGRYGQSIRRLWQGLEVAAFALVAGIGWGGNDKSEALEVIAADNRSADRTGN